MKLILKYDLLLVNVVSVIFILIVALCPSNILRIILSIPFVLFFVGYTTISFFFPKKDSFSAIERIVLSIVLSIVIVTFIGLGLSFSPWGISLYPIILSIIIFIIITSLLAWYRRRKLKE
jgi:uncharacterized membrane protein